MMRNPKALPAFPPFGRAQELQVAFQPVVTTTDQSVRVFAYESFLRVGNPWNTSALANLIATAEFDSSIIDLDTWVINDVCRRLVLDPELKIWANASQISLAEPGFISSIIDLADSMGVRDRLTIEMTESADGDSATLRRNLEHLRVQAIAVVLDDIADGYAKRCLLDSDAVVGCKFSLETKRLMQVDPEARRSVIELTEWCHRQGKSVVMEGIETPAEYRMACDIGIGFQQGYLFAKPWHLEDLPSMGALLPLP
jgi:EAL domain-containing protein (putative c-di-GMP-specific phosphodiesterase class I)